MPPEGESKYSTYTDRCTYSLSGGSYRAPAMIQYTDNWQTPVASAQDTSNTPTIHRVRFKTSDDIHEGRTIYSADSAYEFDSPSNDGNEQYLQTHRNVTYHVSRDLDVEQSTDQDSQEFTPDIKYSTGSGDSGVHSNSPYLGVSESMSPAFSHIHLDQHLVSIHELDQSHISIGSKKIRNETYV